jgi:hypothetical protein
MTAHPTNDSLASKILSANPEMEQFPIMPRTGIPDFIPAGTAFARVVSANPTFVPLLLGVLECVLNVTDGS